MDIIIGSSVIPVAFSTVSSCISGVGAITAALGGILLGLRSWLGYASTLPGGVKSANKAHKSVMLAGNMIPCCRRRFHPSFGATTATGS